MGTISGFFKTPEGTPRPRGLSPVLTIDEANDLLDLRERGATQAELASHAGVSRTLVVRLLQGKIRYLRSLKPRIDALRAKRGAE